MELKVCVLGNSRVGKTALCRALAEQPLNDGDYQPTCAVRIQECTRQLGQEQVKVQLWDVAGGSQFQSYWELLSKDIDGVLLLVDPVQPEQERQLEQLYLRFAQPNSLTMKQCLVLGLSLAHGSGRAAPRWAGLQGKLKKLPSGHVALNISSPEAGRKAAGDLLDKLLSGCLAQRKDRIERSVMGE
ncbi:rab-like intraflagellar transport protein 22 [Scenedesmus sp. NREL 46B-D3]|nr:rab-like intraflagellar transport protein 22 [Scenedesmus sp. NREL 46B-D3]